MKLWRIAAETRKYPADDLSGGGAARSPGRWNDLGEPVVYAAETISLAVLETAAHLDDGGLPLNRYLLEIDVPDAVWALRETLDVATLPPTWSAIPAGQGSVRVGSAWLASLRSPILRVPSVMLPAQLPEQLPAQVPAQVPEERAALLNPLHPACKQVTARVLRRFDYNRLFRA